jgi:NAD(P)-dependent dehydrogenase (short-subunit alcohol dehydrogenase family)
MKNAILSVLLALFIFSLSQSPFYDEFKGKIVLVTGGSTGIGFSTAMAFARAGAHVTFCARERRPDWYNGLDAQKTINNDPIVRKSGGTAHFIKADVSKRKEVKMVIEFIISKFGRLDIAINNAGVGGFLGPIHQIPMDELIGGENDPILNNVYGTINCMHEEISHWVQHHQRTFKNSNPPSDLVTGIIVNLSSYNGIRGAAFGSMYAASKHAIAGLTRSVALEYSDPPTKVMPRIRINALAPGLIDTALTRNQIKFMINGTQPWVGKLIKENDPEWLEMKTKTIEPSLVGKRIGSPDEMADIILYLCSSKATYITGTIVSGDFGSNAK